MSHQIEIFDGREIPCSVKHGQVIAKWQALPVGAAFVLINNHDPARMRDHLAAQWPGTFTWEHLVQGPDEFRIKITKLKPLGEPAVSMATSCEGH